MTCTRCEVVRARILAVTWRIVGKSDTEIASMLRSMYNAEYYTASTGVYRASSVPPFTPYHIL